jgi:diguanylate cyclase (GGDEF)-like protein/PAS domain S-box-containing protein
MDASFFKNILDSMQEGVYFVDKERRITFWSRGAENISGYLSSEVVGRGCQDNILKHIDELGTQLCHTGCPLAETLLDGLPREAEVFLHHKQGHRLQVAVRITPMRDASGEITGAVEIFSDTRCRQHILNEISKLRHKTLHDELTGLGNRTAAQDEFDRRLNEFKRYGIAFGLLFIDVDHFKNINDTWGHDIGDKALVMLSRTLHNALRSLDTVCRWGGEEFVAIIPKATPAGFSAVAERIRRFVETSGVPVPLGEIKLTVSIGGAMVQAQDSIETLLARADAMMYRAKSCGRNCVSLDGIEPSCLR